MAVRISTLEPVASSQRKGDSVWLNPNGMQRLIRAVANLYNCEVSECVLRRFYSQYSIAHWLASATAADLRKLRKTLYGHHTWGVVVHKYILACWAIQRTDWQMTIKVKSQRTTWSVHKQLLELRRHTKFVESLARDVEANMLWVFDWDTPTRNRPNTYHVHCYCDNKRVFKTAQRFANLLDFFPRGTVHTAVHPVYKPILLANGFAELPPNVDKKRRANSLSYGGSKVAGIDVRHINYDRLDPKARLDSHFSHVVEAFTTHKGGRYRHWGYSGFGLK